MVISFKMDGNFGGLSSNNRQKALILWGFAYSEIFESLITHHPNLLILLMY